MRIATNKETLEAKHDRMRANYQRLVSINYADGRAKEILESQRRWRRKHLPLYAARQRAWRRSHPGYDTKQGRVS